MTARVERRQGPTELRRIIANLEAAQRRRDGRALQLAALAERLRRRASQARFAAAGDRFGAAGGSLAVANLARLLDGDADDLADLAARAAEDSTPP